MWTLWIMLVAVRCPLADQFIGAELGGRPDSQIRDRLQQNQVARANDTRPRSAKSYAHERT
jgi:hypothetical protein